MTTDLVARLDQTCVYCASPDIDMHHYREDNPSQGKGMGGHHDLPTLGLCREHHQGLHDKRWVLMVEKGLAQGCNVRPNGRVEKLFERPLVLDDSRDEPEFWSEAKLCTAYVAADRAVMLWKGRIAAIFWARKRYNEDWAGLAASAITRHTGEAESVSARSVRRWANLWLTTKEHFDGDDSWIDQVGRSVAYWLCEARVWSDDALELARLLGGGGLSQRATIKRLRGADNGDNFETCVCRCGNTHRKKG